MRRHIFRSVSTFALCVLVALGTSRPSAAQEQKLCQCRHLPRPGCATDAAGCRIQCQNNGGVQTFGGRCGFSTGASGPSYGKCDGNGIAGWNMSHDRDMAVPFDFEGSGHLNGLLFYRTDATATPRTMGTIVGPEGFKTVFGPAPHLEAWDLRVDADTVLPLDLDGDGRIRELLVYRPRKGNGKARAVRFDGTKFVHIWNGGEAGIEQWDLQDPHDRIVTVDLRGDGRRPAILIYRPGARKARMLEFNGTTFAHIWNQGDTGIEQWDLASTADRIVPVDLDSDGRQEILIYRPGAGKARALKWQNGTFVHFWNQGETGIEQWDLKSRGDVIVPIDLDGDGRRTELLIYRQRGRKARVIRFDTDRFIHVWNQGDTGIGPWDLAARDYLVPFEYDMRAGDELLVFRPGTQTGGACKAFVLGYRDGKFSILQ